MSEHVYVSTAYMAPRVLFAAEVGTDYIDSSPADTKKFYQRNMQGESLPRECFPTGLWRLDHGKREPRLRPLFYALGYWGVNGQAAEVLSRFDLGSGSLFDVELLDRPDGQRVDEKYFFINFGNAKDAFLPEKSPKAIDDLAPQNLWLLPYVPKDNDIGVSSAALEGPDLWVDPRLAECFFVSNRLGKALKAAHLDSAFVLRRAPIYR